MSELMRESLWLFEVLSDELPFKVRPIRGTFTPSLQFGFELWFGSLPEDR